MLRKFTVRNYRNFKDEVCIDFGNIAGYQFNMDCINDGIIGKMLIYGRNATGKTNLGKAIMDIRVTILDELRYIGDGVFLNADSEEDAATFSYTFQFEGKELVYRYARHSEFELQNEELIVNGKRVFKCDFIKKEYDFDNLKSIGAETANTDRYLQSFDLVENADAGMELRLPFLRWVIGNVALRTDSVVLRLTKYVRAMKIITAGNGMMFYQRWERRSAYEHLEDSQNLQELEAFFNAMGVECKLVLKRLPDGQKELYFAHDKLVPFYENVSSGTRALFNLYNRLFFKAGDASFMYLDEFDAFYHYEMAENVMRFFKKKYPNCQIILTSHNTNLMTNRIMRPDCLFILSRAGTLTALCNATQRELREGHNLEKMYISGEFEQYE